MRHMDITGRRYGRLLAIAHDKSKSFGHAVWECKCDCGATHFAACAQLNAGVLNSCGCSRATHGHTRNGIRSPTFKSWESMLGRCRNKNDTSFSIYGGRGITVCEQWGSFGAFLSDMGERPEGASIDRVNVNGNYEPANCRWATRSEQQRNRRDSRKITANGVTKSINEWAEDLGTSPQLIAWRIKNGMSADAAVTKPVRPKAKQMKGK